MNNIKSRYTFKMWDARTLFKPGDLVCVKLKDFNYGFDKAFGVVLEIYSNSSLNVLWFFDDGTEQEWSFYSSELQHAVWRPKYNTLRRRGYL